MNKNENNTIEIDDEVTPIIIEEDDGQSAAQAQLADMTNQLLRLQAEFDNYRKRMQESVKNARADGRAEVIERLLPVVDSFAHAKNLIKDEKVLSGVNLISDLLIAELSQFGLSKIPAERGDVFDPCFHNAVMAREEGESGLILEVIQDGYKCGSKVIRATTVIVSS